MVKLNYSELSFEHLVIFENDSSIFAAARTGDNRSRIFLIYENTGNAYTRNGRADSWESLDEYDSELIRNRVAEVRGSIPVYKLTGSHPS